MSAEVIAPGFDYDALPTDIGTEAKAAAESIKTRMRWAIVQVGTSLKRIQDRLPYGLWGKWLSAEFGMTQRTAQNYIGAAELASGCEKISKLRSTTLYLLAAPSTPDPVRQEVIERFEAGEVVPDRAIRKMVEEAKFQAQQKQRRPEEAAREAKVSPRRISKAGAAYYYEKSHVRSVAIASLSRLLRSAPVSTIEDLSRLVRDAQTAVSTIPLSRRVALAREHLDALGVSVDDLRPIVDGGAV